MFIQKQKYKIIKHYLKLKDELSFSWQKIVIHGDAIIILSSLIASDHAGPWVESRLMMTSSNGNIFRVTGPLCGEFTGLQWIPRTKSSGAELWCFLWSAPNQTAE